MYPVRPVRGALPDRRDDDGKVLDPRALRGPAGDCMTDEKKTRDRREFLMQLGTGAGICAIGYQGAASMRSLIPNVSYDAPTTVKLGMPHDFPDGLKFLPDERLFVFR